MSIRDISLQWMPANGYADWTILDGSVGADLQQGGELQTAFLLSLFSNRVAEESDLIPDGSTDRRGWWGDAALGSRLWLLDRAKLTDASALQAQNYATEALQWMIDDGLVAGLDIKATVTPPSELWLFVGGFQTLAQLQAKNYAWTWRGPIVYPAFSPGAGHRAYLVTEGGVMIDAGGGAILTI